MGTEDLTVQIDKDGLRLQHIDGWQPWPVSKHVTYYRTVLSQGLIYPRSPGTEPYLDADAAGQIDRAIQDAMSIIIGENARQGDVRLLNLQSVTVTPLTLNDRTHALVTVIACPAEPRHRGTPYRRAPNDE